MLTNNAMLMFMRSVMITVMMAMTLTGRDADDNDDQRPLGY